MCRVKLERFGEGKEREVYLRSLAVPCLAEKALVYLYAEQNLLSRDQVGQLICDLRLDSEYVETRLSDNGRSLSSEKAV